MAMEGEEPLGVVEPCDVAQAADAKWRKIQSSAVTKERQHQGNGELAHSRNAGFLTPGQTEACAMRGCANCVNQKRTDESSYQGT